MQQARKTRKTNQTGVGNEEQKPNPSPEPVDSMEWFGYNSLFRFTQVGLHYLTDTSSIE